MKKNRGLFVVPKVTKNGRPLYAGVPDRPAPLKLIEYVWKDEAGHSCRRQMPWKRPATVEAIEEWIADYLERVEKGYRPQGFQVPPMILWARVFDGSRVVAEWKPRMTAVNAL